jgi:magnesium chelatase subunit D
MVFPRDSPPGQRNALARLARVLSESHAARVGETTVVSAQVHLQGARDPEEVSAILGSDAGQVFYHRERAGEVLHIDVFHSPGCLGPRDVARSLLSALSGMSFEPCPGNTAPSIGPLLSYIDIQTGGGGGRIDGHLCYGQESGVRQVHLTHVHVTALAAPEVLASVFTIVAAVESAIEGGGLELRKIRRVRTARGMSPVDMGGYQASSDSLLKQLPEPGQGGEASPFLQEALARQVAREVGSAGDARRLLEQLAGGLKAAEFSRLRLTGEKSPEEVRRILSRSHLMQFDGQMYKLTDEGALALAFLKEHSHEIEAYLRRVLWSLPRSRTPAGERKGHRTEPTLDRGRGPALPRSQGEPLSQLAVAETVASMGIRTLLARDSGFVPSDLRFSRSRVKRGSPVILLLDASASMAGRRMRAAKEVARHLILAGKEKVCIVTFQDSDANVVCPFTRSARKAEAGLMQVQAIGLTPLAKGLEKALELSTRSLRKPLILCITDGIPTVPSWTLSPVEDALAAARNLAKRGVRFGCIGLEPNRGFLTQMTSAAKGTLYVVDELEASTLAAIARKENP